MVRVRARVVVVFNYLLVTQCYTVFCQQRLSGQNQHRAWARARVRVRVRVGVRY